MARSLRSKMPLHNRHLGTPATPLSSEVVKRSVFGTCGCYNRLLQSLFDLVSVKLIQRHLQIGLRKFAQASIRDWHNLFSRQWHVFYRDKGSTLSMFHCRFNNCDVCYLWLNWHCVPQQNRTQQVMAINTLSFVDFVCLSLRKPFCIGTCDYNVIVCPSVIWPCKL